jgi:tetratricopeptide (TPR) repeat protein
MASVRVLPARPFVHRDRAALHLSIEGHELKVASYREWSAHAQPAPRPAPQPAAPSEPAHPTRRFGGMVLTGAATLVACTATPPARPPWNVAPVLRHDGADSVALAHGYLALAQSYEQQGRRELAAETFAKAAQVAGADAALHTLAGVGLARLGHAQEAVPVLRHAATLQPGEPAALNNLGHALMLAGRDSDAVAVLRQALVLEPAHPRAIANLAEARRRLGEAAAPAAVAQAAPAAPLPTAAAATAPAAPKAPRLAIVNGMGLGGAAARMAQTLQAAGLTPAGRPRLQNLVPYQVRDTVVEYRPGFRAEAEHAARSLPGARLDERPAGPADADLRIVLGHDQRAWLAACLRHNVCSKAVPMEATARLAMR